jgi:formylglycine-generating enzyme required for sulfatase activity
MRKDGDQYKIHKEASWRNPGFNQTESHPVVCMSQSDGKAFAKWLSQKTGKSYRLPYEAEWEYAAKNRGQDVIYPWGNASPSCNNAVMYEGGYGCGRNGTWPVCSKTAGNTANGLCDMVGNVKEWCEDRYEKSYYDTSPEDNPKGPEKGFEFVLRGSDWGPTTLTWLMHVSLRTSYMGDMVSAYTYGFRCVRDLK